MTSRVIGEHAAVPDSSNPHYQPVTLKIDTVKRFFIDAHPSTSTSGGQRYFSHRATEALVSICEVIAAQLQS